MFKKKPFLLVFSTFLFFIFLFASCNVHDSNRDLQSLHPTAYPAGNSLIITSPEISAPTVSVDTKKLSIWID